MPSRGEYSNFYIRYNKNGKPVQWLGTNGVSNWKGYTKVSKEQFIKDGGPLSMVYYTIPDPTPDPTTLRDKKIESLEERNEFLEDCIAEMAKVIYSDPNTPTV